MRSVQGGHAGKVWENRGGGEVRGGMINNTSLLLHGSDITQERKNSLCVGMCVYMWVCVCMWVGVSV